VAYKCSQGHVNADGWRFCNQCGEEFRLCPNGHPHGFDVDECAACLELGLNQPESDDVEPAKGRDAAVLPRRRRRRVVVTLCVVVLVFAASGGGALWLKSRASSSTKADEKVAAGLHSFCRGEGLWSGITNSNTDVLPKHAEGQYMCGMGNNSGVIYFLDFVNPPSLINTVRSELESSHWGSSSCFVVGPKWLISVNFTLTADSSLQSDLAAVEAKIGGSESQDESLGGCGIGGAVEAGSSTSPQEMSSWARNFHQILGPYDEVAFTDVPKAIVSQESGYIFYCAYLLSTESGTIAKLENSPSASINDEMMQWAHDTNAYSLDVEQMYYSGINNSNILKATSDVKDIKKDMSNLTTLLHFWKARH